MLPKTRRIERVEFPSILATGKRFHSPHFVLYEVNKKTAQPSRFSFSISKKIIPQATGRNLYRRRGYAVINQIIPHIKPGFICFFSYKKGSYPVSFDALKAEVLVLLRDAGVIS